MNPFISQGCKNMFEQLSFPLRSQKGIVSSSFPNYIIDKELPLYRANDQYNWFKGIVDGILNNNLSYVTIEDDIAVLANVSWKEAEIVLCQMHAIITPNHGETIEDYYCDESVMTEYFRLDVSDHSHKGIFSHPYPHLHLGGYSMRHGMPIGADNIIADFIESIYIQYKYDVWLTWAEQVLRSWENPDRESGRDMLSSVNNEIALNGLKQIENHREMIEGIKRHITHAKNGVYSKKLKTDKHMLLKYP